jgi:phosphonate transport system substrate-binding protein
MKKTTLFILSTLVVAALMLAACAPAATPTAAPPEPTEPPPAPTEPPPPPPELGTEENPLIWAFVPSGEMERVSAGAEAVADLIFEATGLVVNTFVATEYAGVIEAMCSDPPKAHIASLATFAYLLASSRGCAEAELVSVRFGSATYNGQIFVRADSGIEDISELGGKTFCRNDELSTSSWIVPSIEMAAAGVDLSTLTIVDTGAHENNVIGVLRGDCDAGASYVDARTRVEEEFPNVMEDLKVIFVTGDVPNDGVQYNPTVPREIRDKINAALLAMLDTEEGKEALTTAYQWDALQEIDDSFYDPFRQVLDAAGMAPEDFMP